MDLKTNPDKNQKLNFGTASSFKKMNRVPWGTWQRSTI